ncbi:hypothetical protein CKJ89_39645, partial [Klebsiella pneumoniae]
RGTAVHRADECKTKNTHGTGCTLSAALARCAAYPRRGTAVHRADECKTKNTHGTGCTLSAALARCAA